MLTWPFSVLKILVSSGLFPLKKKVLINNFSGSESESHSVMSNSNYTVHGILQARILEWVAFPFCRDLPNPEIEPRSPALQEDSLPTELPGKPNNTGVGGLSLLQQIFPTQELNRDLLHRRQILYQLSYQGSKGVKIGLFKKISNHVAISLSNAAQHSFQNSYWFKF